MAFPKNYMHLNNQGKSILKAEVRVNVGENLVIYGASKRLQRSLQFPNNKRKYIEDRSNKEGCY